MYRKNPSLAVTALIVGVLVAGGNVWAQSIVIPVEGTSTMTTTDPGVQWTDADGITHIRGMIRIGPEVGQDADGTPISAETVYFANINIDMATGNGDYVSKALGENIIYGDLNGTFRGGLEATITAFVFTGTYNYPKGYGDLAGWKHRGTWTSVMGTDFVNWEGFLHIPGEGGGDKAAAFETFTLSAVKSLYR